MINSLHFIVDKQPESARSYSKSGTRLQSWGILFFLFLFFMFLIVKCEINILNCISKDKVPFMEIIRQNPLNTSGKSAKTQRQGWGTRTKPTHSYFARRGHMLGNQHRAAAFQI